jgi:hypothetical protein
MFGILDEAEEHCARENCRDNHIIHYTTATDITRSDEW